MPANRQPRVMDNPYYEWSPLSARPPLRWPNGARVALCVIVNVDFMETRPPTDVFVPPSALRRGPYPLVPDIHETSNKEYGNRVGIFRVMKVLDRHGIKGTLALDAAVAERCPPVVREAAARGWEFIGHGVAYDRMITEKMPEAEERRYLRRALDAVKQATGVAPRGWIGADHGESSRTVRLLAEQGVRYVCDWPNDEQPYRMKVPKGEMVSLPTLLELDDVYTHRGRAVPIARWAELVTDAFDKLHQDGAAHGRMLVLNVHAWTIGQPLRIKYLDRALGHVMRHDGVWAATGSEIVDWYLEQRP
jgi:peptidoglycan/xylan/chitin deacetylase (PgdA/CDA1 family)